MIILYFSLLRGPKRNNEIISFSELLINPEEKKIKNFCFDCQAKIPKRGYHCDICKICIRQYDHHCTWINNCVGKKNIGRFIFFLLFLIVCLGFLGLISFLAGLSVVLEDLTLYKAWFTFRY